MPHQVLPIVIISAKVALITPSLNYLLIERWGVAGWGTNCALCV